jgi:hypothetical protein
MAEIAYLLGAGASAQCIPVVKKMAEDIRELLVEIPKLLKKGKFSGYFEDTERFTALQLLEKDLLSLDIKRHQLKLVTDVLEKLLEICENHYSIDTYAKKMYLTDKEEFRQLKLDLCFYFTATQIWHPIDKRYDNFFSSVITDKGNLPNKVRLLSWNYDFQLEQSYGTYCKSIVIDDVRSKLQTISPFEYHNYESYANGFKVFKLNGSARIKTANTSSFLLTSFSNEKEANLVALLNGYYEQHRRKADSELKFAWENEHYSTLIQAARYELSKITVLVIIGYSFPFFNREVDKALFAAMHNLEVVYIQDICPEDIEETMQEIEAFELKKKYGLTIYHKKNLEQFVFPKELDLSEPS